MSDTNKKITLKKPSVNITPEMERRMRLLANLVIDRIFEDKQNNTFKFQANFPVNKNKIG